jgi:hypothetical protein
LSRFRRQVADALEAVTVHPSGTCSWCGRRQGRVLSRTVPAAAASDYLVAVLARVLYESFYCPGAPIPSNTDVRKAAPRQDADFVEELSVANAGQGCWTGGWRVDGRSGDDVILRNSGLRVRVKPSQTRIPQGEPAIGDAAQSRLPKELLFASPGFYTAGGDADLLPGPMLRLYFHVVASAAASLVGAVTLALNGMGIPFRLKVVNAPERFSRCDAAVLYLRAAGFEDVRPFVRELRSRADVQLRDRTPAFTKPLRPGIGLAEHPASGESFGEHRCRLLAQGIVESHAIGARHPHERLAIVEAHFASHGIDLDAPYLERGSVARYAL